MTLFYFHEQKRLEDVIILKKKTTLESKIKTLTNFKSVIRFFRYVLKPKK